MPQEKIDVVIPWVDPSDGIWQADKNKYSVNPPKDDSKDEKFFRDWDILRYLLRSIETNMPWVNKIHFLTYGHIPKWMKRDHPDLLIHNHSSFFKKGHAFPVFSSDAIEMNLKYIPGLTEKFIYFNDDEVVVKPVKSSRFFQNNLPVDTLVQDIPRGGWLYRLLRTKDVYPDICKNCLVPLNGLISKKELRRKNKKIFFDSSYTLIERVKNYLSNLFSNYLWITPNHSPQPLLKSTIETCEKMFPTLIKETGNSRFRSNKDICHYLFRNFNLITGEFFPKNYHDTHCIVLAKYERALKEFENFNKYTFLCVNDSEFLSHQDYLKLKPVLEKKLVSIFPNKSSYEK